MGQFGDKGNVEIPSVVGVGSTGFLVKWFELEWSPVFTAERLIYNRIIVDQINPSLMHQNITMRMCLFVEVALF